MRRFVSLLIVLMVASFAMGQTLTPPTDAAAQVEKIFATYNHSNSPGCTVGVSLHDQPVLSAAYGMADLEHGIALTPDSVLEPGSVSKQFTAAAILLLAQDGKLSIDDPVRKYLPELPEYGAKLTIRNLLNHTSGLRDWGNILEVEGWPRTTRANTNANVLEIASRQRSLNYAPGDAYSYSNTGFNLMAIVVERVSGKSLAEFTHERIFVPLGMTSTQWRDDFQRIVPNRAVAYTQSDGKTSQLMPFESAYGNGGLLTTVGDLLRWNRNFTEMKVGGPALIQSELQQGRLNDGRTIAYAAGLMIFKYKGLNEVSHSGATAGYRGWLARYPEQGLSVALMCNTGAANPGKLGHAVADVYLASLEKRDAVPSAAPVDAAILQAEAGLYRSIRDHSTLPIESKDGHLQIGSGPALKPVSTQSFTIGDEGPVISFESNGTGEVVGMKLADEVDGGHRYEKVARTNPTRAELAALAGEYTSDEANVTLKVTLEEGGLVIHRRSDAPIPLKPTYADGFDSELGSIRFMRDASGKGKEMSIGEDRLWDLRLRRVK
jgi:CubicO group peptidase (beta-lactamase class C family)